MLLSRRLDDREIQLKKGSKSFFQISGAGHEAILVAAGMQLEPGRDWFFPYYRDRALCLALGLTPYEMLLAAVGAKADPTSGGRQMPAHWSKPDLHLVSGSSAVSTQCLHAVGCAEASQFYLQFQDIAAQADACSEGDVVYVSLGDGSTSEGEFWESLNTTCTRRLPVVFLVEDNGYAISVPVEIQTPGGDIARLVSAFPGLEVISVDGTDALASYAAMRRALAYARGGRGPVLVRARVVRLYSHSQSDDERHYKSEAERDEERTRDPLGRFSAFLTREQLGDDNTLARIAREVDDEIQGRGRPGGGCGGSGSIYGARLRVFARCGPGLGRVRRAWYAGGPTRSRWFPPSTARSRTRWRGIRGSWCSAKTSRTAAGPKPCRPYKARVASSEPH